MGFKETDKFNSMIEAFECDFVLALDGTRKLGDLNLESKRLKKDIELLEELSFLLRSGKAKIMVEE